MYDGSSPDGRGRGQYIGRTYSKAENIRDRFSKWLRCRRVEMARCYNRRRSYHKRTHSCESHKVSWLQPCSSNVLLSAKRAGDQNTRNVENYLRGRRGEYYAGDEAWDYLQNTSGYDLKAILTEIAEKRDKEVIND